MPSPPKRAVSPPGGKAKPGSPGRTGSPSRPGTRGKTPAADAAPQPAPEAVPNAEEPAAPAPEPEPEPEPEPVELSVVGPDALPLDMRLATAAAQIAHESYWKRRAEARGWLAADPAAHGGSWKALYFERRCADLLSGETEANGCGASMSPDELRWHLALAAPYVRQLHVRPRVPGAVDYGMLVDVLGSSLSSLKLSFGAHAVGTAFDAEAPASATAAEMAALGAALRCAESLTALDLSATALDDAGAGALAAALGPAPVLSRLDVSYNALGDAGAAALAPLVAGGALAHLLLGHNALGAAGAAALAAATSRPGCGLIELELRLNPLGDEGAAELLLALRSPSCPLARLGLSTTGAGVRAAAALAAALRDGGGAGCDVDLSNNPGLGSEGGAKLAAAAASAAGRLAALRLAACALSAEDAAAAATVARSPSAPGAAMPPRVGVVLRPDALRPPQQAPVGPVR